MIFAELQYEQDYSEVHSELVEYLKSKYPSLDCGLQGDSWIWIFDGDEKVAIDTFSSMTHQIKSESPKGHLAKQVIEVLSTKYKLIEYDDPELEPHEDF